MKLSPGVAGFIKGIGIVILSAVAVYVSDPTHLTFLGAGAALLVAGVASGVESWLKTQSSNTTALFGMVKLK